MGTQVEEKPEKRVAIYAVIYGIVSVFAGAFGFFALTVIASPLLGIVLMIFGVVLFGWSCFVRSWFFHTRS